jgi:predicted aspartyl protease
LNFSFNPHAGLIVVRAELTGPGGSGILQLALDTGATTTLINVAMLVALGYDPALSPDRIQVTTGSGVEFVPRIDLQRLTALGLERYGLQVLAHTLPPTSGVDGLLGLDFFRDSRLSLDFRGGQLHID